MADTQSNLSHFIPEIWSRELLRIYDKTTVMKNLVNTDYQGEISQFGDTVNIRKFGSVSVNTYTRGATISTEALSSTLDTLTIDTSQYFAFEVDDLDIAQADISVIEGYTTRAAVKINQVIDSAILAKYVDVANVLGSDASPYDLAASSNTPDIYNILVDVGVKLDEDDIPSEGRWLVVPPRVAGYMRKNSLLVEAQKSGDGGSMMRTGMIGNVAGFDIYVSTNLSAVDPDGTGAQHAAYNCLAGTKDFLSFASQVAKVEAVRPTNKFSTIVRGLFLYGMKVLQPNAACVIKIDSTTI